MNKRRLIVTIIISLLIIIIHNCLFAVDSICTVGYSVNNSTPKRGDEITITVSVKNITEPIATVGFTVNYDQTKFDSPTGEALNGWEGSVAGTTYVITAPSYEATSTAGNIYTLKFKVKSDAEYGDTKIAITKVQIAKDDASVVDLDGTETTITIKEENKKEQESPNESNDANSGNKDIVIKTGNENNGNVKKIVDNSQSTEKIPHAGKYSIIGIVAVTTVIIFSIIITAILLKKNNDF